MYLMYADESGDTGLNGSPTKYFALSGIVVHELRWRACLDQLVAFRKGLRSEYGLRLREEFHAARFITSPGDLKRIERHRRLSMIRNFATTLASIPDISVINILVDKHTKPQNYQVFDMAWKALIQRFENTISHHNFPGPRNPDDLGLVFCDHTTEKRLTDMIRRMRSYNPVPHQPQFGAGYRNMPLVSIAEDPSFLNSAHSYFIQAVDLCVFLLYQRFCPNSFFRKKSGHNYFLKLAPILCTHASRNNNFGIVEL